ncbi:MAG TPA: hypothetical protein VK636_10475 [Gemmatimonadaceae bacterium]|nr:hypothetical protein [Gemmatimonadaceae bacterium]
MGCIARLGCLVVLAIVAVCGWFTRDRWLPERFRPYVTRSAPATVGWEPLTERGSERTRAALAKLEQRTGPAFQTLTSSDVASYAFGSVSKSLSSAVDSVSTHGSGDVISMRARVRTSELGGASSLGPLASMLGEYEWVQLSGTFHVIQPGLAEFDVRDVKVHDLPLPSGMIPQLVKRLGRGQRPPGMSPSGLPLPIPRSVGDIRVAGGKVTLYKSGQ